MYFDIDAVQAMRSLLHQWLQYLSNAACNRLGMSSPAAPRSDQLHSLSRPMLVGLICKAQACAI
jgi:hypothetical protein